MKTNLLFLFLLLPVVAMGQETKTLEFSSEYVIPDTTGKICKERGHVSPGVGMSTLMWCPPHQIDYPDSTVMVYPACNTTSYVCARCGKYISEREKESRVVTWRRPIQIMDTTFFLTDSIRGLHLFSDESKWISGTEATVYKEPSIDFYNPGGKIIQSITWRDKVLTFQMLLDYEKHCYNDSTKVRRHKDNTGICMAYDYDCIIPEHYENIWVHKQPTFQGFIEWYKNKIK